MSVVRRNKPGQGRGQSRGQSRDTTGTRVVDNAGCDNEKLMLNIDQDDNPTIENDIEAFYQHCIRETKALKRRSIGSVISNLEDYAQYLESLGAGPSSTKPIKDKAQNYKRRSMGSAVATVTVEEYGAYLATLQSNLTLSPATKAKLAKKGLGKNPGKPIKTDVPPLKPKTATDLPFIDDGIEDTSSDSEEKGYSSSDTLSADSPESCDSLLTSTHKSSDQPSQQSRYIIDRYVSMDPDHKYCAQNKDNKAGLENTGDSLEASDVSVGVDRMADSGVGQDTLDPSGAEESGPPGTVQRYLSAPGDIEASRTRAVSQGGINDIGASRGLPGTAKPSSIAVSLESLGPCEPRMRSQCCASEDNLAIQPNPNVWSTLCGAGTCGKDCVKEACDTCSTLRKHCSLEKDWAGGDLSPDVPLELVDQRETVSMCELRSMDGNGWDSNQTFLANGKPVPALSENDVDYRSRLARMWSAEPQSPLSPASQPGSQGYLPSSVSIDDFTARFIKKRTPPPGTLGPLPPIAQVHQGALYRSLSDTDLYSTHLEGLQWDPIQCCSADDIADLYEPGTYMTMESHRMTTSLTPPTPGEVTSPQGHYLQVQGLSTMCTGQPGSIMVSHVIGYHRRPKSSRRNLHRKVSTTKSTSLPVYISAGASSDLSSPCKNSANSCSSPVEELFQYLEKSPKKPLLKSELKLQLGAHSGDANLAYKSDNEWTILSPGGSSIQGSPMDFLYADITQAQVDAVINNKSTDNQAKTDKKLKTPPKADIDLTLKPATKTDGDGAPNKGGQLRSELADKKNEKKNFKHALYGLPVKQKLDLLKAMMAPLLGRKVNMSCGCGNLRAGLELGWEWWLRPGGLGPVSI